MIPVRRENGKIYGRGAVDAKGALAAFVWAAKEIKDSVGKEIGIIGAVEEEVSSSAGARNIVGEFNPRFAIIGEPSGWNGITLGYKGNLHIEYIVRQEKLHFSGKRITAAENGVQFWIELKNYCDKYNKGKKLFDALLPTLISLTSLDDDFHLEMLEQIVLRLPPDFDVDAFKNWLYSKHNGHSLTFTGYEEAIKVKKNTGLVRSFLRSVRKQGGKPVFKYKTGTSDMNVVGKHWKSEMVAYGPGDSALDHAPNEHIFIDEFHKGIEILKRVLKEL